MPLMEWSREYSVGSPKMDSEHQMIFSLMNDLYEKIESGKGHASLPYIFTAMKAYSVYHFQSEEALLTEKNFPDLDAHKKMHEEFVGRLNDFEKDLADREMDIAPRVMTFLKSWWINHIQGTDKKYSRYVK